MNANNNLDHTDDAELAGLLEHFDFHSPVRNERYHELNDLLVAQCPHLRTEQHGGYYVVSNYDDALMVQRDWRRFSSAGVKTIPPNDRPLMRPTETDPPYHKEIRRLLDPYFTKAAVDPLAPHLAVTANELIDAFADDGHCDAAASYALPLPMMTFFKHFLDTPLEQLEEAAEYVFMAVLSWSDEDVAAGFAGLQRWCHDTIARRKVDGPGRHDVVDAIVFGTLAGRPLEEEEQDWTLVNLTIGGLDTSASVIGFAIEYLAHDSELQQTLRDQPDRIPDAVEEFLRLGAPAPTSRFVRAEVDLGDVTLRPGDRVVPNLPAANRDPSEFANPHEVDLDRTKGGNRHLTFGVGPHRCIGSNLARMSIQVGVEVLLDRLADIRPTPGTSSQYQTKMLRSCRSMPIDFTSR